MFLAYVLAMIAAALPSTHPPTPTVTSLGVTRSATLGSHCWQNGDTGECADAPFIEPRHHLAWHAGRPIVVDLKLPARSLQAQAMSVTKRGARVRRLITVSAHRRGTAGRRWVVRLPSRARADNVLSLFGQFTQGEVSASIGIREQR